MPGAKFKMNDDDRFNEYVQTIVQSMDPHTDYFPPVEKRSFEEEISGRFYGTRRFVEGRQTMEISRDRNTRSPEARHWKSGPGHRGEISF